MITNNSHEGDRGSNIGKREVVYKDTLWESDLPISSIKRYSRQIVVPGIQVEGQKVLEHAKVLIIGMGGLGSPVLTYLAMAGIKSIGIVDFDRVELHNLQRQSVHTEGRVGEYKTRSAVEFVRNLNSEVEVTEHLCRIEDDNIMEIIESYDVVVDCCDQIDTRYLINDCCRILGRVLVSASVLRWEGQIVSIGSSGSCYRCIFPHMKTTAPNCDQSGVVGSMCGVIGTMQATEVIKMILGCNRRTRMTVFNGMTNFYQSFEMNCKPCALCVRNGTAVGLEKACAPACALRFRSPEDSAVPVLRWEEILPNIGDYCIVDIRKKPHFQMFRVGGSVNIPEAECMIEQIRSFDKPVVISCYRGFSSGRLAGLLIENGVEAYSACGGIEGFKAFVGFDSL